METGRLSSAHVTNEWWACISESPSQKERELALIRREETCRDNAAPQPPQRCDDNLEKTTLPSRRRVFGGRVNSHMSDNEIPATYFDRETATRQKSSKTRMRKQKNEMEHEEKDDEE
ncbi:hypothetical protein HPB50_014996 [Hyalomma asiaticum]|uniref:Uncharacterized protein n=1 Tax=Hyalomma asiaticum TaxID=266040 RepID=A0ACB7SQK2_HYAAI|nr:hypothetical protein HPB50_014996 [Hyalomma asiaticum]